MSLLYHRPPPNLLPKPENSTKSIPKLNPQLNRSIHRHYPKEGYENNSNHWKAMVDHYVEFDTREKNLDKLNRSFEKKALKKELATQIYTKIVQGKLDREQEQEQDIKCINVELGRLKQEDNRKRANEQYMRGVLKTEYQKTAAKQEVNRKRSRSLIQEELNKDPLNVKTSQEQDDRKVAETLRRKIRFEVDMVNRDVINRRQSTPRNSAFYAQPSVTATQSIYGGRKVNQTEALRQHVARKLSDEVKIGGHPNVWKNRLSQSMDCSTNTSPVGIFNEYYANQNKRKEMLQKYAQDMRHDVHIIAHANPRPLRDTVMEKQALEKAIQIKLDNEWEAKAHRERSDKKMKQIEYAKELELQMCDYRAKITNENKMNPVEKMFNMDNLHAWKEKDTKLYASIPGWGDNHKNNSFWQKRRRDNVQKNGMPLSHGNGVQNFCGSPMGNSEKLPNTDENLKYFQLGRHQDDNTSLLKSSSLSRQSKIRR